MLCCRELTTPLNNASMVVPVGENGSLFIISNFLVQEAKAKAIAQHVYGMDSSLEALPTEIKQSIANDLKYNYGTPQSVIDRIFALKRRG